MNKAKTAITVLVILILSLVAGVILVKRSQDIREKAAPLTNLSFSPATTSFVKGGKFSTNVNVDTGTNVLTGVDIELVYNPAVIQIDSIVPSTNISGLTSNTTGSIIKNQIDNISGNARFIAYTFDKSLGVTGSKTIISILGSSSANANAGSYQITYGPFTALAAINEGQNAVLNKTAFTITLTNPTPVPTAAPTAPPLNSFFFHAIIHNDPTNSCDREISGYLPIVDLRTDTTIGYDYTKPTYRTLNSNLGWGTTDVVYNSNVLVNGSSVILKETGGSRWIRTNEESLFTSTITNLPDGYRCSDGPLCQGYNYEQGFYDRGNSCPSDTQVSSDVLYGDGIVEYYITNFTSPTLTPAAVPTATATTYADWDVDENGSVDVIDIGIIVDNYGLDAVIRPRADVDKNGSINVIDIGIVVDHYL